MTFFTSSQLSRGSPMPMKTVFVSSAASSMPKNWDRMSAADRFPWNPCRPVMQNLQFILHPAWEDTQRVLRSPSGIITASTALSGLPPTGNRYLLVPSDEVAFPSGRATPTS